MFKYRLPEEFKSTNIPTDTEYKAECKRLCDILDVNKKALTKVNGITGFGIGISKQDWRKLVIFIKCGSNATAETMNSISMIVQTLPGITADILEGWQEKRRGKGAFAGQKV